MFCRYCGTQLEDGSQFCYRCGKKVITQNVTKVEAPVPEKAHKFIESDEQTVAVHSILSPQKKENGYPPTERWDTESWKNPGTSSEPVQMHGAHNKTGFKFSSPQDKEEDGRPESKLHSPQDKKADRRSEPKFNSLQIDQTVDKAETKKEVPAAVMISQRNTDAFGNKNLNKSASGDGALVAKQTYKLTSIGLLAVALIITLTQAWYSISAGLSSLLGLGGYFNVDSYLPESARNILTSMQNGKLGLIDSYRILKAIYDIMDAFVEESSDVKTYVTLYLCIVAVIIGIVSIELLLKVLDKSCNFVAFATYLIGLLITYGLANQINNEIDRNIMSISIWPVISALLALVSSIVWIYYQKTAPQISSGEVKKYSWNASDTRAKADYVINKSRETAEVIWQGSWGDYARHHKVAVIISASAYIGLAILLRITGYSDFRIMLRYCYSFFTAVSIGLAAVYAEHKEYRFLAILGAFCFAGDLILNFQELSYASSRYLFYILFGNVLAVGVIYLIGRYAVSNTLLLMTAGGALVKLILVPLIGYGSVYFDSYKIIYFMGIVGAVLFYMFGNEAFCAILGLPEWRFEGASGKQTIRCPVCGSEVEAGSAFCSRCGSKLS